MRVHNFDTVESGHTRQISVNYATPICIKRQAESTQKQMQGELKKEAEAHTAKQQPESTQQGESSQGPGS